MVDIDALSLFVEEHQNEITYETLNLLEFKIYLPYSKYTTDFQQRFNGEAFKYQYNISGKDLPNFKTKEHLDEDLSYVPNTVDIEIVVIFTIYKDILLDNINTENISNVILFSDVFAFEDKFKSGTDKSKDSENEKIVIEDNSSKLNVLLFSKSNQEQVGEFVNIINIKNFKALGESKDFSLNNENYTRIELAKDLYLHHLSKDISSFLDFPFIWNLPNPSEGMKQLAIKNFLQLISNKQIGDMKFKIKGVQSLILDFSNENNFDKVNIKQICQLINFTIDDRERFLDKILIIRNVITIYFSNETSLEMFCKKFNEIVGTVEYNFELYIQEKIQIFLEQKNKLITEAVNVSRDNAKLTTELISAIRTILISLIGTVFVSFISSLGDQLNKPLLLFSIVSYTLYFIGSYVMTYSPEKQIKLNEKSLEQYITEIGNENIIGLDFDTLKSKFLEENNKEFERIILKLRILLGVLITVFSVGYLSLRFDFNLLFFKSIVKFILGVN